MENKLIESIGRTFAILEAFSQEAPKMTLQQITKNVGLPKVTVFRYLRTLVSLGYVAHDPGSRNYNLSPRALLLGHTALASIGLREMALPYMQELSRLTKQDVNLGILDRTGVIYIDCIRNRRQMFVPNYVGAHFNIYQTSIGLVLLAFKNDSDVRLLIKELLKDAGARSYIGSEGKLLWERIKEIRKNGYAVNNADFKPWSRAIAAPILDGNGNLEAAINMPVFTREVSLESLLTKYLPLLIDTARRISEERGFQKAPPLDRARHDAKS